VKSWPRFVTLALALVPVAMLAFMAGSVAYKSTDAVAHVGSRPDTPARAESADTAPGNCGDGEARDDDGDGFVNDGCPANGPSEQLEQCAAGDAIDDDGDGKINDGCLTNLVRYGPLSISRFTTGLRSLFGTDFSTIYSSGIGRYGLRPAIMGTLWVTVIAMVIAVPMAMAMAIFISEFPLGQFGRVLQLVLSMLAGIPPIVYALMAIVFVGPFIKPKFTADFEFGSPDPQRVGVAPADWPPSDVPWNAGAFPWDPSGGTNSVLLAGILLALLVIPFITPLILDAFRNVPREPKEASLALGVTRWHTLRRVTLPWAMPGIVGAIGLGTLRVIGDVMIVLFVVGFEANMPNPLFDVLERTGPLTSSGAALLGGHSGTDSCISRGNDCTVGYFSALLLLVVAVVVVAATTVLERRYRRRSYG
jgi:phosphate transport system permease protein